MNTKTLSEVDVSLVGITEPRIAGIRTAEELIAYTARVSNPANQLMTETAPKLLRYLVNNKHWSPFEMVHIVVEINTTRDIARQILRHRSFSFQEFSQRYADASQLGFTIGETRMQDKKNRQASIETSDEELMEEWKSWQEHMIREAKVAYQWALDNGIAKEQARKVLPEGLTNSRLYMSGTLRSWLHYIMLRTEIGTQKEHRMVAEGARNIITNEFPSIADIVYDIKT